MRRGRRFCVGSGCERCLGGVKTPPYSTARKGSVGANSVRPCGLAAVQDCTGRRRLAAHNERRHPAELARSCGSMPHWGIDRCATPQRRPLRPTIRLHVKSMLASPAKPPLCKGRWHGGSRDGGIGACAGALGCIRKVTIPQSALSRSQLPLHKGAFNSTPIEFILAPEGH